MWLDDFVSVHISENFFLTEQPWIYKTFLKPNSIQVSGILIAILKILK